MCFDMSEHALLGGMRPSASAMLRI